LEGGRRNQGKERKASGANFLKPRSAARGGVGRKKKRRRGERRKSWCSRAQQLRRRPFKIPVVNNEREPLKRGKMQERKSEKLYHRQNARARGRVFCAGPGGEYRVLKKGRFQSNRTRISEIRIGAVPRSQKTGKEPRGRGGGSERER